MMGWYGGGFGGSGASFGVVWLLLPLIGALVAVLRHTLTRTGRRESPVQVMTPLEQLDRRFALGELDAESYRWQRSVLLDIDQQGR